MHVLLHDQHRQAGGADAADQFEHLLDDDGGQAGGGFIEQQQLGVGHQGAADGAHLLFAARHGAGELVAAFFHPGKQVVDEVQPLGELLPRGGNEGAHAQIVLHRHARKQPAVFRCVGDAELDDAMRRGGDDIRPLHAHFPFARADQA